MVGLVRFELTTSQRRLADRLQSGIRECQKVHGIQREVGEDARLDPLGALINPAIPEPGDGRQRHVGDPARRVGTEPCSIGCLTSVLT